MVNEHSKPCFYNVCSVPYAKREKVCDEKRRLEKEGFLESAEYSEWAAPIVPIMKEDGSISLCRDYKLTVNRASKNDL